VLGHPYETTRIYTKVDLTPLRAARLPCREVSMNLFGSSSGVFDMRRDLGFKLRERAGSSIVSFLDEHHTSYILRHWRSTGRNTFAHSTGSLAQRLSFVRDSPFTAAPRSAHADSAPRAYSFQPKRARPSYTRRQLRKLTLRRARMECLMNAASCGRGSVIACLDCSVFRTSPG